ncbi:MAG: YceD family protein [Collinsella sp.]
MAEFPSVTVDLSEQLEFPGDSYPLTGKVDVATYTVGEKEYQLQDGIDYDVVFTNAGTGVLLSGMVRAHATGECDRCLEPASFDIAGEIEEVYLFNEPEEPEAYEDGYELLARIVSSIWVSPSTTRSFMDTPFVVLCKPDCRGLCPTCGCNLNVEQCDCAAQAEAEWAAATENPFAALKNLKLDE